MGRSKCIRIKRIVPGRGDMVMARPAILESIRISPDIYHVMYCMESLIPILSDIEGLQCIPVPGKSVSQRNVLADQLIEQDGQATESLYFDTDMYANMNDCCIKYESATMPNVDKSRQEIFCEVLNVEFKPDYNVIFTQPEHSFADSFLADLPRPIVGVHIKPAMIWREYPYMEWLLRIISKDIKGTIVTIDNEYQYKGRRKNIVSLLESDIRKVWATMAKMDVGIGVDSWGCHAWGATGVPIYGIFGPTDPNIFLQYSGKKAWAPLTKHCPLGYRCWYKICGSRADDNKPMAPPKCLAVLSPKTIWRDAVEQLDLQYMLKKPIKVIEKKEPGIGEPYRMSANVTISTKIHDQVALLILEGLGGTISASDHAKKIYEATGQKSYLFIRKHEALFDCNPYVSHVECVGDKHYKDYVDNIFSHFDNLVVIKTGLGKWYHEDKHPLVEHRFERFADLYESHPAGVHSLERYNLNFIQMANFSLGLPFNTVDSYIYNTKEYGGLPRKYIVVSNGVDSDHKGTFQTKSWPYEYWNNLVKLLDIAVVHIGTKFDKPIHGVIDLRGKTTIPQLLYILEHANGIICQEGGLMHLAYSVHNKKTIVMRGPTRGSFFRYPGQYYIDSTVCESCYWKTDTWWYRCPKQMDAECMKSIKPDFVASIVKGVLYKSIGGVSW